MRIGLVVNALVGMIWTFVWCVTVRLAVLGCGFIVFCGCFLGSRGVGVFWLLFCCLHWCVWCFQFVVCLFVDLILIDLELINSVGLVCIVVGILFDYLILNCFELWLCLLVCLFGFVLICGLLSGLGVV